MGGIVSRSPHARHSTVRYCTARVSPLVLALQANLDTSCLILSRRCYGPAALLMILGHRKPLHLRKPSGQAMMWLCLNSSDTVQIHQEEKTATMNLSSWQFSLSFAERVRLLLLYRANLRAREAVPTPEGGQWGRRRTVRRRTALEAAASCSSCRRIILDFLSHE